MSRQISIFLVLTLSVFISQCDQSKKPRSVLNETIYIHTPRIIDIQSTEVEFYIFITTERFFPTSGYEIESIYSNKKDSISIMALDIKEKNAPALQTFMPALSFYRIELPLGVYPISFIDAAAKGDFLLSVEADTVIISKRANSSPSNFKIKKD